MHRLVVLCCGLILSFAITGCSQSATPSAEETAYLDVLKKQTKMLDDSLGRFDKISEQFVLSSAGTDPNALAAAAAEWGGTIATETELWKRLQREAQALTPPARFAELQTKNLEMLKLLTLGGHDLAYAMANNNPYYLSSGGQYFTQARDLAGDVKDLVKDAR